MNNKKLWICIIVVLAFLTVLVAVFLKGNRISSDDKNKEHTIELSEVKNSEEFYTTGNNSIAKGDGGYYYMGYVFGYQLLMFFDENLKESIPLCSKADCSHDGYSCNAFFAPGEYILGTVYYYNDSIYLLKHTNGMAVLTKVSKDGTSREKIAELIPNDNVSSVKVIFHNDDAYVYDSIGGIVMNEEHTETITRFSLDGKEKEVVYEYTGIHSGITCGRSYDSKLFFTINQYEINKEKGEYSVVYKGIRAYDYDTHESGIVLQDDITSFCINDSNQKIYYVKAGEGLFEMNIKTQEKELLYADTNKLVSGVVSCDDNYIYVANGGTGSLTEMLSFIKQICIVIDYNGNVVDEIEYFHSFCFVDNEYIFDSAVSNGRYMEKSQIGKEAEWIEFWDSNYFEKIK